MALQLPGMERLLPPTLGSLPRPAEEGAIKAMEVGVNLGTRTPTTLSTVLNSLQALDDQKRKREVEDREYNLEVEKELWKRDNDIFDNQVKLAEVHERVAYNKFLRDLETKRVAVSAIEAENERAEKDLEASKLYIDGLKNSNLKIEELDRAIREKDYLLLGRSIAEQKLANTKYAETVGRIADTTMMDPITRLNEIMTKFSEDKNQAILQAVVNNDSSAIKTLYFLKRTLDTANPESDTYAIASSLFNALAPYSPAMQSEIKMEKEKKAALLEEQLKRSQIAKNMADATGSSDSLDIMAGIPGASPSPSPTPGVTPSSETTKTGPGGIVINSSAADKKSPNKPAPNIDKKID